MNGPEKEPWHPLGQGYPKWYRDEFDKVFLRNMIKAFDKAKADGETVAALLRSIPGVK